MRFVDERMEKKNDRYRIESLRGEWAVRIHHFIIAAKDLKKKSAMPKRPECAAAGRTENPSDM